MGVSARRAGMQPPLGPPSCTALNSRPCLMPPLICSTTSRIVIPMGITIREVVEQIGGGIKHGREFKAVQLGGPSGGCIPARLADTPIDYDALAQTGAIMGSGGMVVLDERDCMVDIARFFLKFTQAESCGKCTFCRIGTKRML